MNTSKEDAIECQEKKQTRSHLQSKDHQTDKLLTPVASRQRSNQGPQSWSTAVFSLELYIQSNH